MAEYINPSIPPSRWGSTLLFQYLPLDEGAHYSSSTSPLMGEEKGGGVNQTEVI